MSFQQVQFSLWRTINLLFISYKRKDHQQVTIIVDVSSFLFVKNKGNLGLFGNKILWLYPFTHLDLMLTSLWNMLKQLMFLSYLFILYIRSIEILLNAEKQRAKVDTPWTVERHFIARLLLMSVKQLNVEFIYILCLVVVL